MGALGRPRSKEEVASHCTKIRRVFSGELRSESHSIVRILEACAGADDLEAVCRNPESGAKPTNQERHLSACSSPVQMCLVDYEEELLFGARL